MREEAATGARSRVLGGRLLRIAIGSPGSGTGADLLWSASASIVFAAALVWPLVGERLRLVCPFRALTGLPCPTCGATRSIVAFVHLRLGEALIYNPLAFAAAWASVGAVAYAIAVRIGLVPRIAIGLGPAGRGPARVLATAAVAASWLAIILAGIA